MSSRAEAPALESSIAPHLLRAERTPKHAPGTYNPPYPSFSARFGEEIEAVVMAYFGVQTANSADPVAAAALQDLTARFAADGGPAYVDRARYIDAVGYTTTIGIAYWSDPDAFHDWYPRNGEPWLDPTGVVDGVGRFLELVAPSVERFETIYSAPDTREGISGAAPAMSGMIEEHAYWGSMRDRLPLAQNDPLYPSGEATLEVDGAVRTVRLHGNACLIRSGQDYADTEPEERELYLGMVEPPLRAGMDFLRDQGLAIGCYDNRYMVIIDDDGSPTDRTFGVSWWRDMSALEEWSASHETHVQIFGAAMRHLSTFGPSTRLRLYHEVTVPSDQEQRFIYVGCHDRTGLLRAIA